MQYRMRSVSAWTDSDTRDGTSINVAIEQDVDRPKDLTLVIGGRSLSFVGDSNEGAHIDVRGLAAIDELIRLLQEARQRATEWERPRRRSA